MEQKKIYPYIIDNKRLAGYYELLLDDNYKVRIFDKKKDKEIYQTFLPIIRDYMFWTFNITQKQEFNNVSNDLKGTICANYDCNTFENKNTEVICFKTGICFVITDDEKEVKKLIQYKEQKKMKELNIDENTNYLIPDGEDKMLYMYILELYKSIYLSKVQKDMQSPNRFDRARNEFVEFTEKIYNIESAKNLSLKETKQIQKWQKELNLEKKHIEIDNQFDLTYKNNKLNEQKIEQSFLIMLLVIVIIIGIINLFLNM